MPLAIFIQKNTPQIISEWETFARSLTPTSDDMTPLTLRNHIKEILVFIVSDIGSPQSGAEQIEKSHGGGLKETRKAPARPRHMPPCVWREALIWIRWFRSTELYVPA